MAISFDNALGVHPLALKIREQRSDLLAANLANGDTPNYKAKDLDFQAVLKNVAAPALQPAVTQSQHLSPPTQAFGAELLYRTPAQPSLDGNTVDTEQEQLRFAENALQYQTSLRFLGEKFSGLITAIRGD